MKRKYAVMNQNGFVDFVILEAETESEFARKVNEEEEALYECDCGYDEEEDDDYIPECQCWIELVPVSMDVIVYDFFEEKFLTAEERRAQTIEAIENKKRSLMVQIKKTKAILSDLESSLSNLEKQYPDLIN